MPKNLNVPDESLMNSSESPDRSDIQRKSKGSQKIAPTISETILL